MNKSRRVVLGAAGAMMLGSLCPWASALGIAEISGLALRLGWITLIGGALIVLLEIDPGWLEQRADRLRRHRRRVSRTAAACGAVACLLVLVGIDGYGPIAGPTWGLFLSLIASGTAFWVLRRAQTPDVDVEL